jgi:acetyl esterase/lipase
VLVVLGLLACGVSFAGQKVQTQLRKTPAIKTIAVQEIRNIAYRVDRGADPDRHRLDLYLPRGQKDCPVVIFVHGGAWIMGDKGFFGCGTAIGRCFARQGIIAVFPSYRLSPAAKHPDHIKDLARAFAWTYRNIRRYGGSPNQLFLCGHSAGGHLCSLLATDSQYLKAEGLKTSLINGVVSVSGVYRIPHLDLSLTTSNPSPKGSTSLMSFLDQFELQVNPLSLVFGSNLKVLKAASPLNHVQPGLPPFLLINARDDLPLLPDMAQDFASALKKARCEVQTLTFSNRDHESVMFEAVTPADPVTRAIRAFVLNHLGLH